jgi:hypothetical protein
MFENQMIREGTTKAGITAPAGTLQWLVDSKAKVGIMRARPVHLNFGRWLGDFLDRDTPGGLLPAEKQLHFAAVQGESCVLQSQATRLWTGFDAWRKRQPMRVL